MLRDTVSVLCALDYRVVVKLGRIVAVEAGRRWWFVSRGLWRSPHCQSSKVAVMWLVGVVHDRQGPNTK